MKSLLYVGVSTSTVLTTRQAILAILATKVEERTKRHALDVLRSMCQVKNTTITDCTFIGDRHAK